MIKISKHRKKALIAAVVILVYVSGVASADLLGSVLKVGGIGLLVSKFGPEIDESFNKLTGIKHSQTVSTKVVPVLSVGQGKSIGAVQVTGSPEEVRKVQAVVQIEGKVLGMRIRALIPNDSKNVTKINRVEGVGVSGLIDIKI